MSPTALDPAASAAVITQAREGRRPRPLDFPAGLRPRDATEAYAVQDAVVRARGPIAGWKVEAPSPQAQPARAALTRDSVWGGGAGGAGGGDHRGRGRHPDAGARGRRAGARRGP